MSEIFFKLLNRVIFGNKKSIFHMMFSPTVRKKRSGDTGPKAQCLVIIIIFFLRKYRFWIAAQNKQLIALICTCVYIIRLKCIDDCFSRFPIERGPHYSSEQTDCCQRLTIFFFFLSVPVWCTLVTTNNNNTYVRRWIMR